MITGQAGSGGPGDPGDPGGPGGSVQVIQVVRMISLDDMHSENIWFSWSKPSKYREKLICHVCDGGRTDEQRKVEKRQCSVPQKPQYMRTLYVVRCSIV